MVRDIRWVLAILVLGIASQARAQVINYVANLNGATEEPPVPSPGTGQGLIDYTPSTHMMRVRINFTGLTSGTTASHIHAATAVPGSGNAGVATTTPTFLGFPLGVTSGTYDNTLDMTQASSYNPAYITANGGTPASAEAALAAAMASGRAYLNIHTSNFSGGEIRGFILPVPEPTSLALTGLAGLTALRFARRRKA